MTMKIKSITVIIRTEDGVELLSDFVMPEYRVGEPKPGTFKKVPKSPVLWFKQLLSRYHNI